MKVWYEYTAEITDESGDVVECLFGKTLDEVKNYANPGPREVVVFGLVRNEGDEINGLQDRGYAYFNSDMILDDTFDSGHSVPKRYL